MGEGIFGWLTEPFVGSYSPRENTNSKEYHQYQKEFGYKKEKKEDGTEDANDEGC